MAVKKRAEVSIRWRDFFRVSCSVWVTLVCSVVSSESALIGSSSPVSRSSPSSNYILFPPLLFFSLCLLAFLFLFWLGSATGHRSHTPTTTPFQYPPLHTVQMLGNRRTHRCRSCQSINRSNVKNIWG